MPRPARPESWIQDPNDHPLERARRKEYEATKVPTTLLELVKLLNHAVMRWPDTRTLEYITAARDGARDLIYKENQ